MNTAASKSFQLIAFDMDGTLLNSRQEITPETTAAVNRACAAGFGVVICTGRALDEMRDYLAVIGSVRYLISCSGAYVYDLKSDHSAACFEGTSSDRGEGKAGKIFSSLMEPDVVTACLKIAAVESPMVNVLTERSYVQRSELAHIEDYHMEVYRDFYQRIGTKTDDFMAFYKAAPFSIGKVNFFHRSAQSRARTRERIEEAGLGIVMADNLVGSLECTPAGIDKAVGLRALCRHLGISMQQVIAVGDGDNDLPMLEAAGLAVAMGNANQNVMQMADAVVGDCDHDGCVEAIERFFL